MPAVWCRALVASGALLLGTAVWGVATGHGLGGGGAQAIVEPFNATWRESVAITMLGAGAFFAIVIAWFLVERGRPIHADLYFGTVALVVVGAIAWGARLGDFTTFYLFFAGIAVVATPVAAVAVWTAWERLRATRHIGLAFGLAILCFFQLELGVAKGAGRLITFGPPGYEPIPVTVLAAIRQLPPDAKLAYSCRRLDEIGPGVARLLSIDAHAGRRVVPMCFMAEVLSTLIGSPPSERTENLFFGIGSPAQAVPGCGRPALVRSGRDVLEGQRHQVHLRRRDAPEHPGRRRASGRRERRRPAVVGSLMRPTVAATVPRLHCPRMSSQRHLGEAAAS